MNCGEIWVSVPNCINEEDLKDAIWDETLFGRWFCDKDKALAYAEHLEQPCYLVSFEATKVK